MEMWAAGPHQARMRLMHPWQYTQDEKEERARGRLAGFKVQHNTHETVGQVRIVELPLDGAAERVSKSESDKEAVEVVAGVTKHVRPPRAQFAADVEYVQDEDVVWYEWVGCAGCHYRITEHTEMETGREHRQSVTHNR